MKSNIVQIDFGFSYPKLGGDDIEVRPYPTIGGGGSNFLWTDATKYREILDVEVIQPKCRQHLPRI